MTKLSLPQLGTNNAKPSVPVQHFPTQGRRVTDELNESDISNATVITLPSKQHLSHLLLPHESVTRRKGFSKQSQALSCSQETSNDFSSANVPSNQESVNIGECPEYTQSLEPQDTLTSETGYDIENNKLSLPLPMPLSNDSECVASDKKIKQQLLDEETSKHLFANDVANLTPTKNTYCASAGSDKKCNYKEAETAETILDGEVFDASYCKDDIVLLDAIHSGELNFETRETLTKGSMNADLFNSIAMDPEENTNFQDAQNSRISANEVLPCKEDIELRNNLFLDKNARENISHKSTAQKNLAKNFGQNVTIPKQAVRTKYATFRKENAAQKDMKIDLKCTSAIRVTVAKQSPTKAQHFLKMNPLKMKNTSKSMSYKANQSLNILTLKETEKNKKISKINCVNQRTIPTPERINKCSAKSLQCLSIPTQSWLRKSILMPSTAQLLKHKKRPSLPTLENPDLHQVASKVKTKEQDGIKCLLRNGSVPNEQNLPNINRISNSLNKSPVLQVSSSHVTDNFSALKYSDMFQEINPTEKGPGIYEMFGTPVYCTVRNSTTRESSHKAIQSMPPKRRSICKNSKSNQTTSRITAKISKHNLNSKHKKSPTNVKKKSVDENAGEKNTPLFGDEGQENEKVSGHNCHKKTYRKEALSFELNNQENNGNPSDGANSLHSLSNYEVELDNQYLSTITEISLKQTSMKSDISEDLCKESSCTSVNGDDLGHDVTHQYKSSMLPKSKDADSLAANLYELQQQLNITLKDGVDLDKGSVTVECPGITDAQESITAMSNQVIWNVREDETEPIALCTEDQDNTISSKVKAASNPDFNYTGLSIQPTINTWTAEEVCPPHCFKHDSQDSLTDDLLSCLASALLLEEKITCTDTIEVTKQFLQKEDDSKNGLFQNGNGRVNENSLQSAEYTVTKLSKTSSRSNSSLGHSIESEWSSSCNDAIIWTKGNVLGKGAYGTVYCGLTSQGKLIAVKQVSLDATSQIAAEKEYQKLEEEIELLKNLKHVNIVSFLGTNLEANVVSIFMEFVPGGSIAGVISRFGPLPEPVFCTYTKQILKGVDYLHDNRVIHRDIKGNNVMLMPNGVIKLIDFGCAKRMTCVNMNDTHSEMLLSMHGTPYWMAPEVINETGHGRKSDIWSIGCTVFEMASGKPPLAHMDKMAAMFYIGAHRGLMPNLPEEFSENARDFVQICLTSDQHERPSAKHLLQHPFITKKQIKHFRKTKL
ncbi:mitogen-activated protein kinase kinase kinase 19 [Chiloscyllium punctatum]|uniref:mitogen-activated protein kinase kinase kinase 19 n=1 Tax=Chiloscyllium punctatum TaxID=137246 RepID=UPI003B63C35D